MNFTKGIHWQAFWAKALTFDALIGNTDRHQNNWGIITLNKKFPLELKELHDRLETYVLRGRHHMKWMLNDEHRAGHSELLTKLVCLYPQTRAIMLDCLNKVDEGIFTKILNRLIKFDVPVKLSPERAYFMLKLLNFRHQRLLNELNK